MIYRGQHRKWTVAGASALAAACFVAAPSANAGVTTTVAQFTLHDHPEGTEVPPTYGLRLDNLFGMGNTNTFSFDAMGSSMHLDVLDNGGTLQIHIYGTVYGGHDVGGAWDSPAAFNVDFMYNDGVSQNGSGWQVTDSASNSGSISSGDSLFDIGDAMGNSFYFLPDGHRITGDDSTWVGRGWLTVGTQTGFTQDWLFTGQPIPLPSTVGLAGIGLLGIGTIRRRRSV